MQTVTCKQSKPITAKILGVLLWLLLALALYEGRPSLGQIVIMAVIGTLLLAYSISYKLNSDHKHYVHYCVFGFSVFKRKLNIFCPDYVTVFSARFKKSADWGPVAAIGKTSKTSDFVIRLFKGNKHITVFKTSSLAFARAKATRLAKVLNVEFRQ